MLQPIGCEQITDLHQLYRSRHQPLESNVDVKQMKDRSRRVRSLLGSTWTAMFTPW